MSGKVYFITGANRGLGLEIVKILSSNADDTIIASVRDPSSAIDLGALAAKTGNIHVVKLDASDDSSIASLDAQLAKVASDGIDYFISNAAIATQKAFAPALVVSKETWVEHYITNSVGPVLILQVVYPYLIKKDTRVVYITSSLAGSVGGFFNSSSSAYGQSKAALNYTTKLLSFELGPENFTVVAVHPGVVTTDMGNEVIRWVQDETAVAAIKSLAITPEYSAKQQVELLAKLSKESTGKFLSYDGSELAW